MMISPININTFCDYMHKLYLLDPLPLSVFIWKCVSSQDEVRICVAPPDSLFPTNCKQPTEYLVEDAEAPGHAKTEGRMEGSWVTK